MYATIHIELLRLLSLFLSPDVGFTLRKDNPSGLKDTVVEIQSAAQSLGGGDQSSSHVRYMLEILMAIKNNNMRKIPNYDPERQEHLKKVARGILRGQAKNIWLFFYYFVSKNFQCMLSCSSVCYVLLHVYISFFMLLNIILSKI